MTTTTTTASGNRSATRTGSAGMDRWVLVMRKSELSTFIRQSDRDKFSRPVRVELLSCGLRTDRLTGRLVPSGSMHVREVATGLDYPCAVKHLQLECTLSRKQRALIVD